MRALSLFVLFCVPVLVRGVTVANPHEPGVDFDEHRDLFALFATGETHTAVSSGAWSSANTWNTNSVPGNGAKVVIPANVAVMYDVSADAALDWVLVQGTLEWRTDIDTRMLVDTLASAPGSFVLAGNTSAPMQNGVLCDIVIRTGSDIDVNWDPTLMSRGLILHGTVTIHGAEKTVHDKVIRNPLKGDTTLQMARAPKNWRVGDTLVVAGTLFDGYKWDNDLRKTRFYPPEDEVVTITAVNGTTVSFTPALVFDHGSPLAELKTSVANYVRNIRVRSEGGASTAAHRRGHVMFMHTDKVDVRYAEFLELGRTDKSKPARDVSRISPVLADSNAKGRYSFHFHRNGIPEFADQRNVAVAIGNAAFGSPGWCYVHHNSHALFDNNAAYRCFGSGFVAENGNEVGSWTRNIAIFSQGIQVSAFFCF